MKTSFLLTIAVGLLCACNRHSTDSLKEPINGAFGWALGARLPAAFDVRTNSGSLCYLDPRGNVPPFDQVVLDLTTNRTIFAITGTCTTTSPETLQALERSLTDSLTKKYVFKRKTSEGTVNRTQFGDDAREVILAVTAQPATLALCFRDTDFARQAQQELAALTAGPSQGK